MYMYVYNIMYMYMYVHVGTRYNKQDFYTCTIVLMYMYMHIIHNIQCTYKYYYSYGKELMRKCCFYFHCCCSQASLSITEASLQQQ